MRLLTKPKKFIYKTTYIKKHEIKNKLIKNKYYNQSKDDI